MSIKITCPNKKPTTAANYSLTGRFLVCLLPFIMQTECQANQWKLEKADTQYQISIQGEQRDRLLLAHEDEDTRFVLVIANGQTKPDDTHMLQLWFDEENSIIETSLRRIKNMTYAIELTQAQKNKILTHMINKINLHVRYSFKEHTYREINFSLLGFTAVLNDFLIAHEVGHLDPEWLNENHKTQELMCFYAANFSVLSMLHRKRGLNYEQSVSRLTKDNTDALNEIITDIVKQVYGMPRAKLPHDPRGDKFGIFQRCMRQYQQ